jgi:hypothetical protein
MLEILKSKIITWTQEDADKFHNYKFMNYGMHGEYLWDCTQDGTFLWRNVTAQFFHNNGSIYKLTKIFTRNDWELHNKLYDRISSINDCKIDIPITCSYHTINNENWMYSVVNRPFNTLGDDLLIKILREGLTTDVLLDRVEKITTLLNHFNHMADVYNCNFPYAIPKMVFHNNDMCWVDFKNWCIPFETYVQNNITFLYRSLFMLESTHNVTLNKKQIMDAARIQWKI